MFKEEMIYDMKNRFPCSIVIFSLQYDYNEKYEHEELTRKMVYWKILGLSTLQQNLFANSCRVLLLIAAGSFG